MPSDKGTNIFSEIGKFFKENDATSAMNAIIDMTKALRLSEKRLFGSESKCNCKLTQLQVLGLLMLFPCFMIRNAYNYGRSSLSSLFDCRKDVFYRFVSNELKYRILKPRFYVKYRVLHIFFVSLDANWYESHSRGYGPVFRGCRAARQS